MDLVFTVLSLIIACSITTSVSAYKFVIKETYTKKYKDDKTKLDPVQKSLASANNTPNTTALANLTTADGSVVQFVEPEEGFIFVIGNQAANEPPMVVEDAQIQATSSTTSSIGAQKTKYSDPVVMYEELAGRSAPEPLKEANERRKRYIARDPSGTEGRTEGFMFNPETDAKLPEVSSRLRGTVNGARDGTTAASAVSGHGDRRQLRFCSEWWQTEWCSHQIEDPDACSCLTCKTGTRVEYSLSESIYMNAHANRGTVTQKIEYMWCPDDGEPCLWRVLDIEQVAEGNIQYIQGYGNGSMTLWQATLSGDYAGWDWFVVGFNSSSIGDGKHYCDDLC